MTADISYPLGGRVLRACGTPHRVHFQNHPELLAPSGVKGKTLFHILMDSLLPDHKARWFAGAALSSSEQAMASVMSTALARLNSFLDSEMEVLHEVA